MNNKRAVKDPTFYLGSRYPVTIHKDPEGGFVAEIEELPGCMTQAETLDDVYTAIEDARQAWIKAAFESGQDIPLPRDLEEYSGKFLVRIPRSMHRNLVRAAKQEGVSLNQYVASLLAAGLQMDTIAGQLPLILPKVSMVGMVAMVGLHEFGSRDKPIAFSELIKLPQKELVK
jgi:predicted RNase H-like HicB family nuclease